MIRDLIRSLAGSVPGLGNRVKDTGVQSILDKKEGGIKVVVENAFLTLNDGMSIYIPFWRVETGKLGPSLLLLASQHGNEVQGAEVSRRFMEICARQLRTGSVWMLPLANIPAVYKRRHSVDLGPGDPITRARVEGHNMNLIWPGRQDGNDTERVAYALNQSVLRYCTHSVDIHCWSHFTGAETLSVNDNESSFPLGEVTTTRFISYTNSPKMQMASQIIRGNGGGAIEIELSGQFQMQESQVQMGLNSMINIAKILGMIKGKPRLVQDKRAVRNADTSHEIKSTVSGLFVPAEGKEKFSSLMPEDYIDKGELLGHIIDERTLDEVPVPAPVSGYIWQLGACHSALCDQSLPAQHPYTEVGERIALIVTVQ